MSLSAMLWALYDAPTDDPQSALVLVALAENAHDDGTGAWPSVKTIARKARCSERTAQRRLATLVEEGLICRGDQRMVAHLDGRYRPVVYDLALSQVRGDSLTPLPGSGVTGQASRGDRPGNPGVTLLADKPNPEPSLEPTLTIPLGDGIETTPKPAAGSDTDPLFAEFWDAYPRHVAKGKARTAWRTAIKKAPPSAIIAAVHTYRAWAASDLKFVAHPATWLNGERWLDELPTRTQHPGSDPGATSSVLSIEEWRQG